jgi:hypothetical protein
MDSANAYFPGLEEWKERESHAGVSHDVRYRHDRFNFPFFVLSLS